MIFILIFSGLLENRACRSPFLRMARRVHQGVFAMAAQPFISTIANMTAPAIIRKIERDVMGGVRRRCPGMRIWRGGKSRP